ncbi:hypothetical protein [Reinekea blandensis]|uniref:Uncharacterized protein n=1 Tax=Reinekea blandensis MED297 TaxID=314283 RepID=A4BJW1_9GAMM|nr:hypothetical protein [Reinekea blandensis]EAR07562.1 hypothetical protein MED297_00035 [Reinekea sp. MED297] [Reinekea blandensis MED297]
MSWDFTDEPLTESVGGYTTKPFSANGDETPSDTTIDPPSTTPNNPSVEDLMALGEDFTSEYTGDYVPGLRDTPHDRDEYEDKTRRGMAYSLVGILALIVIGVFASLWFGGVSVKDVAEFGFILGPIVALVSAATGFYYGSSQTK